MDEILRTLWSPFNRLHDRYLKPFILLILLFSEEGYNHLFKACPLIDHTLSTSMTISPRQPCQIQPWTIHSHPWIVRYVRMYIL